jgi:PAS domain S-box-containing protein
MKTNGKVEILIAEDSPTQAAQLAHLLEQHGYLVTAAANGREALALLERRKPSLVISDIVMPELDGYGLCKAIKADKKLKDIPVMLVTTLSDAQDVIRGLECGADNFIRKPYDERYLLSRIDYLLMNLELRKNQKMQLGVEIDLGGHKHFISPERQQILDLLISTYEQAVHINNELKLRETELEHSNQVLHGLGSIVEGLNRATTEHEVAEAALERALELPGIQAGWISLWEGASGFRLVAARNLPPALLSEGAMDGLCDCRRRFLAGDLDHVTNIMECERLKGARGDTHGLGYHASVPLWAGERAMGVMNLVGAEQGLFDEAELKMLYVVGNQVAVALERARLHEHLEQLVEERTAALTVEVAERRRIQEEQARLVAIIEATPDLIGTATLDGRMLYTNQAGLRLMGIKEKDLSKVRIQDIHPEWAGKLVMEEGIPHAFSHGAWSGETAILGPDGREIPILQVILAHKGSDGTMEYLSTIARDITQRKLADLELVRTNRALQMLSRCNEALTRMDDEVELLLQVCRLAVDEGGYRMAWVGYAQEDEALSIVPMAHAGDERGYLASIEVSWRADHVTGQGPAGQAIRSGQPHQRSDIGLAGDFYWRDAALQRGYRSSIALPLRDGQRSFGVLSMYSGEVQLFTDDEVKLLQELADNLAFGIGNIRSRRERRRIEETVLKVAAGVSAAVGTEFFEQLVRNTTEALGADAGFVVRLLTGEPLMARIIAGVVAGQPVSNFDYLLEDTPCLSLMQSGGFVVYSNVRARFPCSMPALFVDAEAYAGRRLDDAAGQPIGMMFVLFREPLKQTELIESTLQIFASRAAAELERLQADAKVKEQASILDKAQNAIVIRDLQHKILYWNQGAERLYRWTAAEALGQSVLGLMRHPADFSSAMDQLLATGEWVGELLQVDKDGLPLAVEGHWTLVRDDQGAPTSVLAFNTDIRERKQAQNEILRLNAGLEERVRQRTTQLQAANKELESFSYSVSHDLRTPLSTIDGFSNLLAKVDGNNVSEKGRHYLNRIRAGAKQMGELIEGLLSLAQLSREQIKLESVDLSAIARRIEHDCREREPERQVQVHIQEGLNAHGDPRLLSAVLQNLLGNAWKFTSRQVLARIDVGSELGADGDTVFFVKDNGAGFDMAFADKLFGTFQRLHSHEDFSGTGVGLATVKRIIERHGGRVWAESKLNEGATFHFTLGRTIESVT